MKEVSGPVNTAKNAGDCIASGVLWKYVCSVVQGSSVTLVPGSTVGNMAFLG